MLGLGVQERGLRRIISWFVIGQLQEMMSSLSWVSGAEEVSANSRHREKSYNSGGAQSVASQNG